jgi:hypothetical protein
MRAMTRSGHAAIEYAESRGLLLSKHADPIEDARDRLSIDEARAVAAEDPSLIYVATDSPTEGSYTYTIFDAPPSMSGGTAWPSHENVEVEADSPEEALEVALSEAEIYGDTCDEYDDGYVLYVLVWDADGIVVADGTHTVSKMADEVQRVSALYVVESRRRSTSPLSGGWTSWRSDELGANEPRSREECEEDCGRLELLGHEWGNAEYRVQAVKS